MENQKDGEGLGWSLPLWSQRGTVADAVDVMPPSFDLSVNSLSILQMNDNSPSKTNTAFINKLT